ncbi:hypothetical protein [Mangrovactinospora gilvigrisea]|uniref:hypothetical protein n=1 Tax=Mangrovactinospora gilvigrisea TaxID=1428644 RepID=UPI000B192335|nr:hypothetical protein [Mangrovactinospora gilvigrisea]
MVQLPGVHRHRRPSKDGNTPAPRHPARTASPSEACVPPGASAVAAVEGSLEGFSQFAAFFIAHDS